MESTNRHDQIKQIIVIANLVAVSVVFSFVDKIISQTLFPFLPTAKIGLANIVILIGIYQFSFKETLIMTVLKVILASLMMGGITAFIISSFASIFSFLGMYAFNKLLKDKVSPVSISVIGGFIHIVVQLIVVNIMYSLGDVILYYGAIMIFVSLITSILIGLTSFKLAPFFESI